LRFPSAQNISFDGHDGGRCFRFRRILRKETRRRPPRSPHKTRRDVSFSSFLLRLRKARSRPSARERERALTSLQRPSERHRHDRRVVVNESNQAIVEAKSTHPVADNRGDSFARTPHFHPECERAINEQINIEYNVSYIYHAMYAYFARDNVYLPGIAKHFLKESLEERSHAELLMNYQIMRGGRVELQAIMPPQVEYDHPEKGDALYAFELSLSLEKLNNDRLIALHRVAGEADDANMQDFIEGELLEDQVKSIEEVSRFVGQLRRMGNKGDAVWHFDQALLEEA
jgi:ferritin heavy chain